MYEVSPNPVDEILTINATLSEEDVVRKGVEQAVSELEFEASIYEMTNGHALSSPRNFKGALKHDIDVSGLNPGIYTLRIRQGKMCK